MFLQTDRLTIRRIQADDWASIRDIWVDFSASPYAQYDKPHLTVDDAVRARIASWVAVNSGLAHMFFAVCLEDRMIGYTALHSRANGYEIGYCFHSAYHKKGYAKESHLALFDHLRTLGITKFTAGTALNNTPSVSLLKSLGFALIGTENVSFYHDDQGNAIFFEGGLFALNTTQTPSL